MRKSHVTSRFAFAALLLLIVQAVPQASDHADPIDLFMRQPLEPGLTDLFVFPSPDKPGDLVFVLCVRRALVQSASLRLEPYTYKIHMDLNSAVGDDEQQVARYGGSIAHPDGITPQVTLSFRLNDDASIREQRFEGLQTTDGISVWSGVRDDPFIFPQFFGSNVVAMVASIPMRAFPRDQSTWIVWGTSERDGRQIDHVGRSLRTQQPRFELLNTLPPSRHAMATTDEHNHPALLRDIGVKWLNLPQLFAYREWDHVPDVLIYTTRRPVGFPNGRLLTDDVAALLARYGDTLLYELSYTVNGSWPRRTTNDKAFLASFPYLPEPWPDHTIKRPGLTKANWAKLIAIGIGLVALWFASAYLFALWYHRRKLRLRYA